MIKSDDRSRSLQWYHENRDKSRARMTARRIEHLERLSLLKLEHGCMDCGYKEHPEALDFDHRPGTEKRFAISQSVGRKWNQLLAEIEKCDIVCANCHRVRTSTRRDIRLFNRT